MNKSKARRRKIPQSGEEFLVWLAENYTSGRPETEIMKDMLQLTYQIRQTNEQKLRSLYKIGGILHSIDSKEKKNLALLLGLSNKLMNISIKIFTFFQSEDDAVNFLVSEANNRISNVFRYVSRGLYNKRKADLPGLLETSVNRIIENYNQLEPEEKKRVEQQFQRLTRFFPLKSYLDDKYFLRYSRCVACGEEAGEVSLLLFPLPDMPNITYPICTECHEQNRPIDYKLLAYVYALYAHNVEAAYDKIEFGSNL